MSKSKSKITLIEEAWEKLFERYDILEHIERDGQFRIKAEDIKKEREPRLMTKFDHKINLPKIFLDNELSILPITRGEYIISHFDAYHKLETHNSKEIRVSLPNNIESLNSRSVTSETVELNRAVAAGIIYDFLGDKDIVSTVSGRMGSGDFNFNIENLKTKSLSKVVVEKAQIEIDGAFETRDSLALFEVKCELSDDFLIRQLYYPYRVWKERIKKPVRSIFMVCSNGTYKIYEYEFKDSNNYSSISLVKQKTYIIEDNAITVEDVQEVLNKSICENEPESPFPQADSFKRVINICELLREQDLSKKDITEQYAFNVRQTDYYTDAARYLGLVEKHEENGETRYKLTEKGRTILEKDYKERQLAFCGCILSHGIFADTLKEYFKNGSMPQNKEIVQLMKNSNLYKIKADSTYKRRSSTIKKWINWIIGLTIN